MPTARPLRYVASEPTGGTGLRRYRLRWLGPDAISALTVSALLIPQGIAYAQLAGMPPVFGLYAGIIGMAAYALAGSSRCLVVGPEAGAAMLTASALALVPGNAAPDRHAELASLLAIMVGVLSLLAGLLKAGALADLFSKPILIGYLNGVALLIVGSQLGRMLGLEFHGQSFLQLARELGGHLGRAHLPSVCLGAGVLAGLLLVRRFWPRVPGSMLAVCVTTLLAAQLHWAAQGVEQVGTLALTAPALKLPQVAFDDVRALLPAALSLCLVNYAGSVLLARSFATVQGQRVDANREFVAQGMTNLAVGLLSGFPVSASDSRTTLSFANGGRSQLVGLLAAALTLGFAFYLLPLLRQLPVVVLAAVVIAAALQLIDARSVRTLWRIRRVDAVLACLTTLAVLVLGILEGIMIAVALALGDLLRRAARPHDGLIGSLESVPGYHDVARHPGYHAIPGLVLYRAGGPLFFASDRFVRNRLRKVIEAAPEPVHWLVLDLSAVFELDATAAQGLMKLHDELAERGVLLALAQPRAAFRRIMRRTRLLDCLGRGNVYRSVGAAVRAYLVAEDAHAQAAQTPL